MFLDVVEAAFNKFGELSIIKSCLRSNVSGGSGWMASYLTKFLIMRLAGWRESLKRRSEEGCDGYGGG